MVQYPQNGNLREGLPLKQFTHVIQSRLGIHGRPAAQLVLTAKDLPSAITVEKDGKSARATSLLALMQLGARQGDSVTVTVTGGDEEVSLRTIQEFFRTQL